MDTYNPDDATVFTDVIPESMDEMVNLLYINTSQARNIMKVFEDFVYSNRSYIEFKTPTIYESQNYDTLSGDSYKIPSMNYSVTAINDVLKQDKLISSNFENNPYKQFKIRATNQTWKDTIIAYLKEMYSDGKIGLSDSEIEELVVYDTDDTKYYDITNPDDMQFTSFFGYTNGVEYKESILIDKMSIDFGKSILLTGSRVSELVGNDVAVFDKYYLYNMTKSNEQSILDNLLLTTDISEDIDLIDGSSDLNDDISTITNLENYRVYALLVMNGDMDIVLKYRLVKDTCYDKISTDHNMIVNNKEDYYEYYNSIDNELVSGYLGLNSIYAVACIGGFHYGFNRGVKQKTNFINVLGNLKKETISLTSDNTKTLSVREYVKNIHSNVVVNSIWDNYNKPISNPVNMVSIGDEFVDMYCLDTDYLPTIKTKDQFSNALQVGNNNVEIQVAKNSDKTIIESNNIFPINLGMYVYQDSTLSSKGFTDVNNSFEGTYYYAGANVATKHNTGVHNCFTYLGTYLSLTDGIGFDEGLPYNIAYGSVSTTDIPYFNINSVLLNTTTKQTNSVIRMKSKKK